MDIVRKVVDCGESDTSGRQMAPSTCLSCSWARNGDPSGSIGVRTETDAVILMFQSRSPQSEEWKSIEQRVPLAWTRCHLGGKRPWFVCTGGSSGPHCGRRVAILYGGDPDFACRECHDLAYASQSESQQHWRTYHRLLAVAAAAEERSTSLLAAYL